MHVSFYSESFIQPSSEEIAVKKSNQPLEDVHFDDISGLPVRLSLSLLYSFYYPYILIQ